MIKDSEIEVHLFEALSDAFENMAFMEVNRTDDTLSKKDRKDYLCSKLEFNGNFDGEFIIYLSGQLVTDTVEALYNIDSAGQTDEVKSDLIRELANTLVGELLSKTVPNDQLYQMGLPVIVDSVQGEADAGTLVFHYAIDEITCIRVEIREKG